MSEEVPVVGITMGDPAGVGAEVIVGAYPEARRHARMVVVGDASVMEDALRIRGSGLGLERVETVADASFREDRIPVLDLGGVDTPAYGAVREDFGRASLDYVERAIDLALEGSIDAIATAPINKQATRLAGSEFAGHTGLLADRTGADDYAMMLLEGDFRVAHVTTHVPLREVPDRVTAEAVDATIRLSDDALRELGIEAPRLAVAGLNPHAGDGGLLGDEEADTIEPAVDRAREAGIDAVGPESPDTVFVRAADGAYDCVVAMYHDQGHIPTKLLGFRESGDVSGVNMTIGLPIVRTSVDHGTAFDIAGEGVASAASMADAVETAARVARARDRRGR